MLIICFQQILSKNYLVYDIKANCFNIRSYFLDIFPLSSSSTEFINADKIIKIILITQEVSGNEINMKYGRFICDKINVIINDNSKLSLTHYMRTKKYHNALKDRCVLFSKCFNVDFEVIGENLIKE